MWEVLNAKKPSIVCQSNWIIFNFLRFQYAQAQQMWIEVESWVWKVKSSSSCSDTWVCSTKVFLHKEFSSLFFLPTLIFIFRYLKSVQESWDKDLLMVVCNVQKDEVSDSKTFDTSESMWGWYGRKREEKKAICYRFDNNGTRWIFSFMHFYKDSKRLATEFMLKFSFRSTW